MALKFAKKAAAGAAPEPDKSDDAAPVSPKGSTLAGLKKSPSSTAAKTPSSGKGSSFFKKGAEAKETLAQEEAAYAMRKEEQGKLWRFWMPDGEDRRITFLDGDLDADGMLDINMYYEHTIRLNGNWENFVCTADVDQTQPCPACESGDRHAFVGVLTVIDHSEHLIKKGPNAGKTIKNTRKLFVAKQGSLKQLTKLAVKRGGLTGCTFDASRTGDKEPNVGNQFDFHEKFDTHEEIAAALGLKLEEVAPANYEEEIKYRSPEELIELGIGKAPGGIGYEKGVSASKLKDEL